ncbi:PE domain-containing protein [Amycolatopsis cihanbeyliensis]|uniref:PE family protein n=1 Tax=Amycolatopsis cihanbeyliensis TaxID=1128664 RepID=A0A542DP75_AMYCI|nr:PE domain-containing protein [Amycolatopsis cihanbeyliensis]TQJ04765.1 PE family protein [Amycolatopsis cihanbeyliensis]
MSGERGFAVDTEQLAAKAAELGELAERAAGISADLERALAATGRAWGTDAVGQSFAAAHDTPARETLDRLRALPEQLGDMHRRLTDAAAAYRAGDAEATDRVRDAGTPD